MSGKILKILHTSDWHIGKKLFNKMRDEEFEEFFAWLLKTIEEENIDVLLVAGDIFDTSVPGNAAQAMYYGFLGNVAKNTCCRHIIITGGNHDSPDFLDAPEPILRGFDIIARGNPSLNATDDVLLLRNPEGRPELVVCALPYLRERDVRNVEAGESMDEKSAKLHEGIAARYAAAAQAARKLRQEHGQDLPVVAMGHLFTAGGKIHEGDGVRNLYIGSLGQVDAGIFDDIFDYVALGHLHAPQTVGGKEHIRYCGSVLPMSFDESRCRKQVCLVEFNEGERNIREIEIPVFRRLESIKGGWENIKLRLEELAAEPATSREKLWLEVVHEGDEIITGLKEKVDDIANASGLEVINRRDDARVNTVLEEISQTARLDQITPALVFKQCLENNKIPHEEWPEYMETFDMVLSHMENENGEN